MPKKSLATFFFLALLFFIAYQIYRVFSLFFHPIFWSAVFAFCSYPVYERLKRSLGGRAGTAAFLTTFFLFLAVVPVIVFLVVQLSAEALDLYDLVVQLIREDRIPDLIDRIKVLPIVQELRAHAVVWDFIRDYSEEWLIKATRIVGVFTTRQAAAVTKNIVLFVVNFFLSGFLSYFFLRHGAALFRWIYAIVPLDEEDRHQLSERIQETFHAVLRGQLLTAFIQAGLAGVIFSALGLPLPILFAALTFLLSLVPILGAASVWLPFVLYLAAGGHMVKAGILLVLGVFGISLADNFIKPAVIGEKTKLPYVVLFIGILGGLKVYGLVGIFLVPTLLSIFLVLIKIYREKYC